MPKTHAVAIYGTTKFKQLKTITYKKHVWKTRKDNVKQRYIKKIEARRSVYVYRDRRITLWGSAKDVKKAREKLDRLGLIPKKKFVDKVSAKDFVLHPEKYAREGDWVDREVKHSP
jgi:NAD(P)H-flavin reductase